MDLSVEITTPYPIFLFQRRGRWYASCREMGVMASADSMKAARIKAAIASQKLQAIMIERNCHGIFWPNEFSLKWAAMKKRGIDLDLFEAIFWRT